MLISLAIEKMFLALGAKRAEVTPDGAGTHWLTLAEAQKAKAKFEEISLQEFGRIPERNEIFRDRGLFACFVQWPLKRINGDVGKLIKS